MITCCWFCNGRAAFAYRGLSGYCLPLHRTSLIVSIDFRSGLHTDTVPIHLPRRTWRLLHSPNHTLTKLSAPDLCRDQKIGSKIYRILRQNEISRSKVYRISRQNKFSKVQDPQDTTAKWNIKIQDLQVLTAKQILKVQDPQDTTIKLNIKIEDLQDLTAKQILKVQDLHDTMAKQSLKIQDPQDTTTKV